MAWRPTQHLLDGELDNTVPGKVTGWMRFAGLKDTVTFDLDGAFHRDIRGATIRLRGAGDEIDPDAAENMESFATHQVGKVGDITAGREPRDYTAYPYIEWYSEQNGRVVLELEPDQVTVIGTPIPAIESDPISREEQARNMAGFLDQLLGHAEQPAGADGNGRTVGSDARFSHWVLRGERIIGEARDIQSSGETMRYAFVRLFETPDLVEFGCIPASKLRAKNGQAPA